MADGCIEAVALLYHYIDGELSDERRLFISRHLDDCPPCFQAFDFEADLRMIVAQRCRERVPDHLRLRIAAALEDLDE
jgi:mycothiol system anti-sigma-R factor